MEQNKYYQPTIEGLEPTPQENTGSANARTREALSSLVSARQIYMDTIWDVGEATAAQRGFEERQAEEVRRFWRRAE